MKLYADRQKDEILKLGGILLTTVDCRICGAVCVPHLVWTDSPPEKAGLCDKHFKFLKDLS